MGQRRASTLQGNRAKAISSPLWGRINEAGRARPRKLFFDALCGERSATPHSCPPRHRAELVCPCTIRSLASAKTKWTKPLERRHFDRPGRKRYARDAVRTLASFGPGRVAATGPARIGLNGRKTTAVATPAGNRSGQGIAPHQLEPVVGKARSKPRGAEIPGLPHHSSFSRCFRNLARSSPFRVLSAIVFQTALASIAGISLLAGRRLKTRL